jgi:UDP-GlcNAc:undecaprenyl-phosphate GlcNAc-1-phosphate transferase
VLTYLVAVALAMAVASVLTPIVAKLAHRFHWLDVPGEARKVHTRAIPRLGGIAVVIAFFTPIIGLAIYTNEISDLMYNDSRLVSALICGALVIVGLGIYDDIRGANAWTKLAVQATVATGMWFAGFRINLLGIPFGDAVAVGYLSLPLTVLWLTGVINALNLIDGLDGLASGVALFAMMVLFTVSYIDHAVLLCVLAAALSGALMGFLFFNFNPARIFLGDSGSMFLGFILASISLWTQRKGATAVALLVPVIALGLPLLDTTLSVVRRVGRGQNPFHADREHLHHRLLALGLSHRNAVLTMYTASAVFALGALAILDNDSTRRAIALSTVAVAVLLLVRRVGVFNRLVEAPPELQSSGVRDEVREAARRIRTSADTDGAWRELASVAKLLSCEEIRLAWHFDDDEQVYHWRSAAALAGETNSVEWRLDHTAGPYDHVRRMPLEERGRYLGGLTALRVRETVKPGPAEQELFLEMLRDALIDFGLEHSIRLTIRAQQPQDRNIVSLASGRVGMLGGGSALSR